MGLLVLIAVVAFIVWLTGRLLTEVDRADRRLTRLLRRRPPGEDSGSECSC